MAFLLGIAGATNENPVVPVGYYPGYYPMFSVLICAAGLEEAGSGADAGLFDLFFDFLMLCFMVFCLMDALFDDPFFYAGQSEIFDVYIVYGITFSKAELHSIREEQNAGGMRGEEQ